MSSKLEFSRYEGPEAKFKAELFETGGYINFSNSGKGGGAKTFTLSVKSFLQCIVDIQNNLEAFKPHNIYIEGQWRRLGKDNFNDPAAKAAIEVQTKPVFVTISKIIMLANSPELDQNNPEHELPIKDVWLNNSVKLLESLDHTFGDKRTADIDSDNIVIKDDNLRDFAHSVFLYLYSDKWEELFKSGKFGNSTINNTAYQIFDIEDLKRLFGVFNESQSKKNLSSANTLRYFDKPVLVSNGLYYYLSTQWADKDDSRALTFSNLKKFIESKYEYVSISKVNNIYILRIINQIFDISSFISAVNSCKLVYNEGFINRFTSSLITKPFVILTGLSGSGKTKLGQTFVQWICEHYQVGGTEGRQIPDLISDQYLIVPVGSDWTNREPLLGYPNALNNNEYILPDSGVLQLILRAEKNPERPYFLILDEMNLSHVERYFADFLSTMESDESIPLHSVEEGLKPANIPESDGDDRDGPDLIPPNICFPRNLFIIGTVNIDETTHMFSPKVLDRANTIEFRISPGEMEDFLKSKPGDIDPVSLKGKGVSMGASFLGLYKDRKPETLDDKSIKVFNDFFRELSKTGSEFGYRTANEIRILLYQLDVIARSAGNSSDDSGNASATSAANEGGKDSTSGLLHPEDKMDIAIMQKLLPKLHGSRNKLVPVLKTLAELCLNPEGIKDSEVESFVNGILAKDADSSGKEGLKNSGKVRYPMSLEKIIRMHRNAVENGFTSFAEA